MEELEVHSKSFLVRWIYVKPNHGISWSIQPHKKSLNFGIFKHPGHKDGKSLSVSSDASAYSDSNRGHDGRSGNVVPAPEKLKSIGMKQVVWIGRCDADKIAQGTYQVGSKPEDAGNYGLVFDNTFSKTVSKTVTFLLITYPIEHPPQWNHQIHHPQTIPKAVQESLDPEDKPPATSSSESVEKKAEEHHEDTSQQKHVHTGVLQKRRRKRHQGYARRFFVLDFETQTLSYYHDRNSPAIRGAMPLDFAAVAHDDLQKEFSIDSGAEIWHLRAMNSQSYESWKRALKKASQLKRTNSHANGLAATTSNGAATPLRAHHSRTPSHRPMDDILDNKQWSQIEDTYNNVSKARDIVRRLARDTDPRYLSHPQQAKPPVRPRSPSPNPSTQSKPQAPRLSVSAADSRSVNGDGDTDSHSDNPRRSFWKLKPRDRESPSAPHGRRTISGARRSFVGDREDAEKAREQERASQSESSPPPVADQAMHDELMEVLGGLNSAVIQLTEALDYRKHAINKAPSTSLSRRQSMESDDEDEFFDALDENGESPLLTIQADDTDNEDKESAAHERAPSFYEEENDEDMNDADASETDESDSEDDSPATALKHDRSSTLFPVKSKSLAPLPLSPVKRRKSIPAPVVSPPSLISFLRKNVGKDFSTISMPVAANEPISLLQRAAETLEYSTLLDKAASATDGVERLIYVTAFAITPLSSMRIKERATRKPFNPMLGETFELVREDLGFRFIAEKVSHRPVQLSFLADSKDWSLAQSPKPIQQFWGKSAEIVTEGKLRLTLHSQGERYNWAAASCTLKNIIAGEKYIEPTGEITVTNETTGEKTVTQFKSGGMFSGRSEEVTVQAYDSHGKALPLGLQGTWTDSLRLTENGRVTNTVIWKAGPLVDKAQQHWGYTQFAAGLNDVTSIEKGHAPPTDSRFRADQRALEEGNIDRAEEMKAKLEESQRARRKEMERKEETWTPRWFTKVEGDEAGSEEVWKLRTDSHGYWEERASGKWTGVVPVLNV